MGQMKLGDIVETILPLHKKIINCRNCGLWKERRNAVPGEGDPNARLLIIGEAPGRSEDEEGRPFVGRAGKVLNEVLAEIGISRNEVFITNPKGVLQARFDTSKFSSRPEDIAFDSTNDVFAILDAVDDEVSLLRLPSLVEPGNGCACDLYQDGDVDGSDLAVFAAEFGRNDCP